MTPAPEAIDRFTRWLYRYRGETAAPFAILMIVLARPTWSRLAAGFTLVVAGECLRLWAASHIGSHARGRTFRAPTRGTPTGGTPTGDTPTSITPTGGAMARTGPYRLSPHPLYAGNLLVCLGLLVAARAGEPWFPAIFLIIFCVQYSLFIRYEDALIRNEDVMTRNDRALTRKADALTRKNDALIGSENTPRQAARLGPAMTRAGFTLEWPTLRTVLALSLILVGLTWWWSAR